MNTLVQTYLTKKPITTLETEHGVYASFSTDGMKASFNYDQRESKESDPLARQCRGLILRRKDRQPFNKHETFETEVVARPFDRFFNHGQQGTDASKILLQPGTKVFEKLDGTLIILYFDSVQGVWHTATRAVPEADRAIDGFGTNTFRTLFELALKQQTDYFDSFTKELDITQTYMFELTSPYNRVVVEYSIPQIHLLGIRHTESGEETCPYHESNKGFNSLRVRRAPMHEVNSFSDLLTLVTERNPRHSEGVVVRGPNFDRVKVKNPAWSALSAIRDSVANSPRRLMEIIILGHDDDVFPMLTPDKQEIGKQYKASYAKACRTYDTLYTELASEANKDTVNPRKALALDVQARKLWMPYFMERFTNKCKNFKEFIEQRRDNTGSWPDSFIDALMRNL